ncbi:MAG: sigma-70 family RNA polymerase sigma factor [Alphaproteobacteria bacterium]|nr:sigma-70 family RNA polymerase sigma factor [Alphaproteobacteria bacterium]
MKRWNTASDTDLAFVRSGIEGMLPRLRRFARGLTGNLSDADDIVQAACEKALGCAEQWTNGTRLDSWLYRIVHTVWLDELRRRRHRSGTGLEEAADEAGDDVVAHVEARLRLEEVRRLMADLPEEQRAVLLLVCVEGLSYRDGAKVLGIPIGTVMSRLARGRAALLTRLGEAPRKAADGRGM